MNFIDWIGFLGVLQILMAYVLNVMGKLKSTELIFILLNLLGAGLACLASILMQYLPFVILEGVWSLVSFIAFINYFKKNMNGEKKLSQLAKGLNPRLNEGEYVFVSIKNLDIIDRRDTLCEFKEKEGTTLVIDRRKADELHLEYDFVASWITLEVHSSLQAIGLTALFSKELTTHQISCNVIAGYYHDHIFVAKKDADKAIQVLTILSKEYT